MSSTQTSSNQTENPKNNTGSRTPTRSPEPVPFGGDDQWIFDPRSKRFDLTRGSPRKLTIDADFDVRHHRGCVIDPNKTVLVVVDMQNFFIHPDCCNHKPGLEAVAPTLKVIERCRRDGIQVAWLNWVINEHNLRVMPPAVQRGFNKSRIHTHGYGWHVKLGSWLPGDQGRCLWEGSWNAELYEPLKRASRPGEDVFLCKDRPSGMWSLDEPMHRYLRESGKKTILFAGVNTVSAITTRSCLPSSES